MVSILFWITFWSAVVPSWVWVGALKFTSTPTALSLCEPAEYVWEDPGTGPYTFIVQNATSNSILYQGVTNDNQFSWTVDVPVGSRVNAGVRSQFFFFTLAPGPLSVEGCPHSFAAPTGPPPSAGFNTEPLPSSTPTTSATSTITSALTTSTTSTTATSTTTTSTTITSATTKSPTTSPSVAASDKSITPTNTTSINNSLLTAFAVVIALALLFLFLAVAYWYYNRRKQRGWSPPAWNKREEKELAAQISPFPRDLEYGQVGTSTSAPGRRPTLPRLIIPGIRRSFKKRSAATVQVQPPRSPSPPPVVARSSTGSDITYLSSPGVARQVQDEIGRLRGENALIGETIEM